MPQLIGVIGYISKNEGGAIQILTLDGILFEVEEQAAARQYPMDTNPQGARRFFFEPDTEIRITVKASEAFARPRSPVGGSTIYKYLDDGGTISKSRDDGGKDPIDDKDPSSDKDPISDKDPTDDLGSRRR
jgi:hypothetical protein